MDWFKVKVSHTLYDGMTDRELAGWCKIMALTAHLEYMPNNQQMLSQCGPKTLAKIEQCFINIGSTLHQCLSKVLEDADEVVEKREYNKIKKRQSRQKLQNVNLTGQTESLTVPSKIREDKIRGNNINTLDSQVSELPEEWRGIFKIWLDYKKDRRQSYKSKSSIFLAYKKLVELSNNNLEVGSKIIEQSIANNWAGLFELKNQGGNTNAKSSYNNGVTQREYQELIAGRE